MKNLIAGIVFVAFLAGVGFSQATLPIDVKRVEYIGDSATKIYYSLGCEEASRIVKTAQAPFANKEEAQKRGFTFSAKCTPLKFVDYRASGLYRPAPETRKEWRIVLQTTPGELWVRPTDPDNTVKLLGDFPRWKRKRVNLWSRIRVASSSLDQFTRIPTTSYSFTAHDGTELIWLYMPGGTSAKMLVQYLSEQTESNDAWALLSFFPIDCAYSICYGELKDFQVFERIPAPH